VSDTPQIVLFPAVLVSLSNITQGLLCKHFSLSEIINATKNFDESRVIGRCWWIGKSVFGKGTKVAIKAQTFSFFHWIL
jgi:hypothetical protein